MRNDLQYYIGYNGRERLKQWQFSEQISGDISTILGYIPALEIIYLKPGRATNILKKFNKSGLNNFNLGKKLIFDRFVYDYLVQLGTTFDQTTIFEFNMTTFDISIIDAYKYYKFPPNVPL
jgi:hypothetical protein